MKNDKSVLFGAWSGLIGMVLFNLALGPLFANFLPPPSPTLSAAANAAIFTAHANGIRIGSVVMMIAASALLPFAAAIAGQMRRIEKQFSPYAYTELAAGGIVAVLLFFTATLWCVAALRPDRPPEITQVVSDIAWIFVVMPAPLGMVQQLAIALAVYSDHNAAPLFPRWLGHVNIVTGLLYIPGLFAAFFITGPFAWDGLLAFWLPAISFGVWACVMFWGLLRAAKRGDVIN